MSGKFRSLDMAYCFRIRCVAPISPRIESDVPELTLASGAEDVILRSTSVGQMLRDAREFAIAGRAYGSEAEANQAGTRWLGTLQRAFAYVRIGADFGARAPSGFIFPAGLEMLAGQHRKRVLNDTHGLMVFECEPAPLFARTGGTAFVGIPPERLLGAIAAAAEHDEWSEREQTAYDLFAGSFFIDSVDARFMMLMMALETLIIPGLRSDAAVAHAEWLIEQTRTADLDRDEKRSLVDTLGWLRHESIRRAGLKLVAGLGHRDYGGKSPAELFEECYKLRNLLAHGSHPRPSRADVDEHRSRAELLLSDLLGRDLSGR